MRQIELGESIKVIEKGVKKGLTEKEIFEEILERSEERNYVASFRKEGTKYFLKSLLLKPLKYFIYNHNFNRLPQLSLSLCLTSFFPSIFKYFYLKRNQFRDSDVGVVGHVQLTVRRLSGCSKTLR